MILLSVLLSVCFLLLSICGIGNCPNRLFSSLYLHFHSLQNKFSFPFSR